MSIINKKCIWCFKDENETTFNKKAHTIPKSLGGQNFNKLVCDECNEYFGFKDSIINFSIEEALKETLCITRERLIIRNNIKRNIGNFKSRLFKVKYNDKSGKIKLSLKTNLFFKPNFQKELGSRFKKGLIKVWFEEFNRQKNNEFAYDPKFNILRKFARFNGEDIPIIYFERKVGVLLMKKNEAETPVLILNRMNYLYENDKFTEIEFLGHVFGFPITDFSDNDFHDYINNSIKVKKTFFSNYKLINKITDVDFALSIMDE